MAAEFKQFVSGPTIHLHSGFFNYKIILRSSDEDYDTIERDGEGYFSSINDDAEEGHLGPIDDTNHCRLLTKEGISVQVKIVEIVLTSGKVVLTCIKKIV